MNKHAEALRRAAKRSQLPGDESIIIDGADEIERLDRMATNLGTGYSQAFEMRDKAIADLRELVDLAIGEYEGSIGDQWRTIPMYGAVAKFRDLLLRHESTNKDER